MNKLKYLFYLFTIIPTFSLAQSDLITIDFKDTPLQDVLRALAAQHNVNIVSEEKLDGKVTIHLTDIPFEAALQAILTSHGLTYEKENNLYKVKALPKPKPYILLVEEGLLTLNAYKAELSQVLRELSHKSGINIVLDKSIKGEISTYLNRVPVERGLETILKTSGFAYRKVNEIYVVGEREPERIKTIKVVDGKLSLDLKDADILRVLREISIQSGLNIVADKTVKGKISSRMEGVDVEMGLRSLLETNGFTCEKVNDIYQVSLAKGKKTFYITASPEGLVSLDIEGGDLKEVLRALSLRTGVDIITTGTVRAMVNAHISDATIEDALKLILKGTNFTYSKVDDTYIVGEGLSMKPSALAFVKSKVIKINWLDAEETLKIIPPIFPKNNIQLLKDQNALAVIGTEEFIAKLEDFIKKIDKPAPQIMIEALIVEFQKDWTLDVGLKEFKGKGGKFEVNLFPGVVEPLTLKYNIVEDFSEQFNIVLQSLIRKGKAEIKANPRIATLNGREASIDVVTKYRYREHRYNEATGRLEPVGVPREIEAGIKLKIKPWVTAAKDIIVEITPEVSSKIGVTEEIYALPITSERKAKTTIRVKDGETIIIGGLIQTEQREQINKIPLLGDIPLIGYLFSKRGKTNTQTELVFYITPRLLRGED